MSDFIDVPASPSPAGSAGNPERPVCTAAEIEAGKAFAIISYVLNFLHLPFFLIPLIMRSDRLSLYHAKQCLMLWLTVLVLSAPLALVAFIFTVVTLGAGACIVIPVALILWVGSIVINIMGIVNAVNGKCVPLPVIGVYAERWFAGIKVEGKPGAIS